MRFGWNQELFMDENVINRLFCNTLKYVLSLLYLFQILYYFISLIIKLFYSILTLSNIYPQRVNRIMHEKLEFWNQNSYPFLYKYLSHSSLFLKNWWFWVYLICQQFLCWALSTSLLIYYLFILIYFFSIYFVMMAFFFLPFWLFLCLLFSFIWMYVVCCCYVQIEYILIQYLY